MATKQSTPKKSKKPSKTDAPPSKLSKLSKTPVTEPLGNGKLCYCGCGSLADAIDWDDDKPLSISCLLKQVDRAKARRASQA